jgi:MOSC domain-containing protein YiiM
MMAAATVARLLTCRSAAASILANMRLVSVNVSLPRTVTHEGKSVATGIFKQPVQRRVPLRTLNLEGDGQADLRVHGGPDKAVYVYPVEHYEFWSQELKRDDFPPGQFGENFTVSGMQEETVHIGDVFSIGQALVQVTQPRVPCFKLGIKMASPKFPRQFLQSRRSGFYLRVLKEGEVQAGDSIELVKEDPERMSVRRVLELAFFDLQDMEGLRKVLRIEALSRSWREDFHEQLSKVQRGPNDQPGNPKA